MKLLLDIGNTSIAWAWQSGSAMQGFNRCNYREKSLSESLGGIVSDTEKPEIVLIASVASDEQNQLVKDCARQQWKTEVWQAHASEQYEKLKNSYTDVTQMGVDRWLCMVAAWRQYHAALCIVDCGTAVTIDLVNADGQHAGGFILPGQALMQQVLIEKTERINSKIMNEVSLQAANNTQQAISHGASLAMTASIERAVKDFQGSTGQDVTCVITGGNAEAIRSMLNTSSEHHPWLVLDGLAALYEASL